MISRLLASTLRQALADFAASDPVGFLARFDGLPAILDEIQYVPGLLRYLKLRIDAAPGKKGRCWSIHPHLPV